MRKFLVTAVVVVGLATGLVVAQDDGAKTGGQPLKGVFPTTTAAPAVPLDGASTVLPCYELPADSAADGNLEKWKGVPPSVSAEWVKHNDNNQPITPCDDFSPALYVGRPKGTNDLMVLVVIQDRCVFGDVSAGWTFADNVELFLDFGRQARLEANPGATTQPDKYQNTPEYAQIGLLPRTPLAKGTMLHSKHPSRQWNMTYTSTPVVGGVAYEVKVDGTALLTHLNKALLESINKTLAEDAKVVDLPENLTIKALPEIIGIDLAILAVDYPLLLEAGAWKNHRGYHRIFGDHTVINSPVRMGGLSTAALAPQGDLLPGITLASKFSADKAKLEALVGGLKESLKSMSWTDAGELIYWAVCNDVKIDKSLMLPFAGLGFERELVIAEWIRGQELVAQAMLNPQQDPEARREMAAAVHTNIGNEANRLPTPRAIVAANVTAAELKYGDPAKLGAMIDHEDLTVVISAARALSAVGEKAQAAAFRKIYDEKIAALTASKKPDDRATLMAMRVFVLPALELLEYRVDPPAEPKTALRREVKQENTSLARMMHNDNNHVYDGKLLREWPAEGPKKLWEYKVGTGVTAAVEVGGKTFVMGVKGEGEELGSYGYCFDAASGSMLWEKLLCKGKSDWNAAGPIVDGEHVYFFPDKAVVCLKIVDGEIVWSEDKAYRGPQFSCPLIVGNVLYLPGKALLAINKTDGKLLWTAPEKPEDRRDTSPASLAYGEVDGVGVIVMGFGNNADAEVMGLSAATGEVFFRKAIQIGFGLCTSPVIDGSRLYVSSGQPGQEFFVGYQMFVKDGKVLALPMFSRKDTMTNYANTLTVWDGVVFGFGNAGLECSDARTGNPLWSARPGGVHGGSHLLLADGLLLIQGGDCMILAEANKKEYRELGRVKVPVQIGEQQPTLANGKLYVRGKDTLVVYDVGAK